MCSFKKEKLSRSFGVCCYSFILHPFQEKRYVLPRLDVTKERNFTFRK